MGRYLFVLIGCFFSFSASAAVPVPAVYEKVGALDSRGAYLPLDSMVYDGRGEERALSHWVKGQAPTLLTFNYMGCPMLCGLQQDGLVRSLNELPLTAGDDFNMLTISLDPTETPAMARQASARLSDQIGGAWTVLTAPQLSIEGLTSAAGFNYHYAADLDQYAHPAVVYVVTQRGRVSQYFSGIEPSPRNLKFALVEAGNGQIGSVIDQVALACLQYDISANSYVARGVMQAGGFAIMGGLVVFFGMLWYRERRRWR